MKTYFNLYPKIFSLKNLYLAFEKAKRGKSSKNYVKEFEKDLKNNLLRLQEELRDLVYKPKPLKMFILRDPKLRKICKSEFRDRIVHHSIINVLESIYEKTFIFDSYANRKNKGTSKAIERLDFFVRIITKNYRNKIFHLKADIRHFFETVNQEILIKLLKRKIKDNKLIQLIDLILRNYTNKDIGMPLGNLTSQFFANVYLNELDYFIKNELKVKYYIRYVDDFIILNENKELLQYHREQIENFLKNNLKLELHQNKSKIYLVNQGINFLGFRNFYHHKLLKKGKRKNIKTNVESIINSYNETKDYNLFIQKIESIFSHIEIANTFNLRMSLINQINCKFPI